MDYQVEINDFFLSDLKEITVYLTEQVGTEIALRVGNELYSRALKTGNNPFAGQIVKKRLGVRKVLWRSYLIYYYIDETRRTVEILRAWHGARDPRTLRLQ